MKNGHSADNAINSRRRVTQISFSQKFLSNFSQDCYTAKKCYKIVPKDGDVAIRTPNVNVTSH